MLIRAGVVAPPQCPGAPSRVPVWFRLTKHSDHSWRGCEGVPYFSFPSNWSKPQMLLLADHNTHLLTAILTVISGMILKDFFPPLGKHLNPRKNRKITFLADCDEPSGHHAHSMKRRKRMEPILLKPTSRPMRDEVTGNRHHYSLSPVWLPSVMHSMDKGTAVGIYPDLQQKHTQGKGMDNPQWQQKMGWSSILRLQQSPI